MLKARQIGASWICAAYDLWYAKFHNGANVFLWSKGELEAFEKLDKCRRIERNLPRFLQHTIKPDSNSEMHIPSIGSTLRALPSTETAGIGFSASIIDFDEWEQHPYATQNFYHAKPTIDSGAGQLIGTFTVDPWKAESLARTTFQNALDKKNSFTPLFFPFGVRPGRNEKWYRRILHELTSQELEGLTPELYMQKNYPRSISEALSPIQTSAAFNLQSLDAMLQDTTRVKVICDGLDMNVCNIYQDFHLGEFYIAATDTSHGVGKDFSVTCIMNVQTGVVVADIMHNLIPPEELAYHSIQMLERFRNPLWYIEANDRGATTISKVVELGYRHLGYQDEKRTKLGFLTEGHRTPGGLKGTRTELWGELIPAINNRQIVIHNLQGLRQFFDIVRNAAKEGRIEAKSGRHDDYPMAVAICWYKKDEVKIGVRHTSKPIEALTFGEAKSDSWFPVHARVA